MKVQELINCVKKFHESFGIENNFKPTVELTEKEIQLRYELLKEENEEYLSAALNGDITEVADALGDQLYILIGTILKHGMQDVIEDVFQEIQNSNMSKLGEDGKPIYREDGKVLKGPKYYKPNISKIINK
jgi:predicted HAD superfamily Cof-like phosphohydrolase